MNSKSQSFPFRKVGKPLDDIIWTVWPAVSSDFSFAKPPPTTSLSLRISPLLNNEITTSPRTIRRVALPLSDANSLLIPYRALLISRVCTAARPGHRCDLQVREVALRNKGLDLLPNAFLFFPSDIFLPVTCIHQLALHLYAV